MALRKKEHNNIHKIINEILSDLEIDESKLNTRAKGNPFEDFISKWSVALDRFNDVECDFIGLNGFSENCFKIYCHDKIQEIFNQYRHYIEEFFFPKTIEFKGYYSGRDSIKMKYEKLFAESISFYQDYKIAFYDVADVLRFKISLCSIQLSNDFESVYKNVQKICMFYDWDLNHEMEYMQIYFNIPNDSQLWGKRLMMELEAYNIVISTNNCPNDDIVEVLGKHFIHVLKEEVNILEDIKRNISPNTLFDYKTLLEKNNFVSKISNPKNFIFLVYRLNCLLTRTNTDLIELHDCLLGIRPKGDVKHDNNSLLNKQELFSLLEKGLNNVLDHYKKGLPHDKNGKERGVPNFVTSDVIAKIKNSNNDKIGSYNSNGKNLAHMIHLALDTKLLGNVNAKDIADVAYKYVGCTSTTLETYISKATKDNLK